MAIHLTTGAEPIPGYKLTNRLGAGGYGEVWGVEAPGGLTKAIKFVYGRLDDDRAARELKSLNRIRAARHPFLLSLERIEVIDGQLCILSELAEGSVKDRFDKCREQQFDGIPRDELLVYMRDTADALDYMSKHHSLQHLDVKPENLLLLGGRIKVADFGLVKEVHDVTASLMGGLTPLYAPPEVYDGRPSRASDQYSLAIVYQEMLTGVLPFSGATAAQLATQHLNSRPRTGVLPENERSIIDRALSKNPADRYKSCVELIDNLCNPAAKVQVAKPQTPDRPVPAAPVDAEAESRRGMKTEQSDAPPQRRVVKTSGSIGLPEISDVSAPAPLQPLALEAKDTPRRPVILISAGGLGLKVLQNISQRLIDQSHNTDESPDVTMLAMDTDVRTLSEAAANAAPGSVLHADATLALPLRRAQDYRNDSSLLLKSMSRRWLYNIPRSQQTEGLRPLGRLAMVDHSEMLDEKLQETFASACRGSEAPLITVVSAISGGCGSGMAMDLGYAIRKALSRQGITDATICGMLVHAAGRNPTAKELAMANSFACLSELSHYAHPDNEFPADEACHLPACKQPPFDHTYVNSFGEDLTDDQFEEVANQLATYLLADATSPAGRFFAAARQSDAAEPCDVRTMGVSRIGGASEQLVSATADMLCHRLIQSWRGEDPLTITTGDTQPSNGLTAVRTSSPVQPAPIDPKLIEITAGLANKLKIDFDVILQQSNAALIQELDGDVDEFFKKMAGEIGAGHPEQRLGEEMLDGICAIAGPRKSECPVEDLSTSPLGRALESHFQAIAEQQIAPISSWIYELTDRAESRSHAAVAAGKWFKTHLASLSEKSRGLSTQLEQQLESLKIYFDFKVLVEREQKAARGKPISNNPVSRHFEKHGQYFEGCIQALALQGLRGYVKILSAKISAVLNQLQDLKQDLQPASVEFFENASSVFANCNASSMNQVDAGVYEGLQQRTDELTRRLDDVCREAGFGLVRSMLEKETQVNHHLVASLSKAARGVTLSAIHEFDVTGAICAVESGGGSQLQQFVQQATPMLDDCGGGKRLLLMLPAGATAEPMLNQMREGTGQSPTVLHQASSDALMCVEMQGLSLAHVATRIVQAREDLAAVADRLRTRKDVSWQPWQTAGPVAAKV